MSIFLPVKLSNGHLLCVCILLVKSCSPTITHAKIFVYYFRFLQIDFTQLFTRRKSSKRKFYYVKRWVNNTLLYFFVVCNKHILVKKRKTSTTSDHLCTKKFWHMYLICSNLRTFYAQKLQFDNILSITNNCIRFNLIHKMLHQI